LVIAPEHAGRLEQHFAVVGDLDVHADVRFADGVSIDFAVGLGGDVDRRLGLPIELLEVDPERAPEAEDFRPDRLARGIGEADAGHAEPVLERPIYQALSKPVQEAAVQRDFLAVENFLAPATRHRDEVMEHTSFQTARILHAHHGQRDEVLVDARRRERIRGPDFAAIFAYRFRTLRTIDAKARSKGLRVGEYVIADPGEREI